MALVSTAVPLMVLVSTVVPAEFAAGLDAAGAAGLLCAGVLVELDELAQAATASTAVASAAAPNIGRIPSPP